MTEQHVSYMTKEQLEKYLRDLRTNRPARPTGSRPPPPSVYQQKRMAAAAAEAAATTSLPSTPVKSPTSASPPPRTDSTSTSNSASVDRRTSRLGRDDSHRRTRTTGSVTFAATTTEFPPGSTELEEDLGDLSLNDASSTPHRRTKSSADWEMQQGRQGHQGGQSQRGLTDREKIERELHERFEATPPPIAPLKINKVASTSTARAPYTPPGGVAATSTTQRAYSPSPSRYVYNDPNQFNKVHYTTNLVPLPSPPLDGAAVGDVDRRDIGTREERGRPPLPTIRVKKQPPEPPVIAVVEPPPTSSESHYSRNITPPSRQSAAAPTPPSISISGPSIPTICIDGDDDDHGVPMITISDDNVQSSTPTQPPPAPAPAPTSRRPLPTPVANPFRKAAGGSTTRSSSVYSNASTTGRPAATCTTCNTHIAGRIVSALGARFHPECFRCYHCSERLEHVGFFPEPEKNRVARAEAARCAVSDLDQRFYCHLDFHEKFSPRCKNCKTPIEGEVVVACGETWHVGHFFCAECGDPFNSETRFVEKDKYAWCLSCYTKRYSSKCRKCKQPVTETVVKALGGEWHVECFCCAIGQKAISKCFNSIRLPSSPSSSSAPSSPHHGYSSSSSSSGANGYLNTGNSGNHHHHSDPQNKVTKPKDRKSFAGGVGVLRRAKSTLLSSGGGGTSGGRRGSIDSGYGGEKTGVLVDVKTTGESGSPSPSSSASSPMANNGSPAAATKDQQNQQLLETPTRPASATGVFLKRMRSSRLATRAVSLSSPPRPAWLGTSIPEGGEAGGKGAPQSATQATPVAATPAAAAAAAEAVGKGADPFVTSPTRRERAGTPSRGRAASPSPSMAADYAGPPTPPMMKSLVAGLLVGRRTL